MAASERKSGVTVNGRPRTPDLTDISVAEGPKLKRNDDNDGRVGSSGTGRGTNLDNAVSRESLTTVFILFFTSDEGTTVSVCTKEEREKWAMALSN